MARSPKLLLPAEYIADATQMIRTAKHRVSILSMLVTDDDTTSSFIQELAAAAQRGITVDMAADVFTYGELAGHFIPTRYFTQKSRSTNSMMRLFKKSGVNFNWLGRFATTPFNGRTHLKWCVVDDTVYTFGGVNLYERGITNADYMFKFTDAALANDLVDEYHRMLRADRDRFSYRSRSFESDIGTVLIDGGLPGDSVIYRRACALARDARDILFVSQYCPTGKLSRLMKQAGARVYFNPGAKAGVLNRLVIMFGKVVSGQKTLYKRPAYLHAKFMIATDKQGKKVAITGSHNFVNGGTLLGTREIALMTDDKRIIKQLEKFFADYVA